MKIENGWQERLQIAGVFDGDAGVLGSLVSFIPNRFLARAADARSGILGDRPIMLKPVKDKGSNFYTARFEYIE